TLRETSYKVNSICVYLRYGEDLELRLLIPENLDHQAVQVLRPFKEKAIEDVRNLLNRIRTIERLGYEVTIYPDAEEYVNKVLYRERIRDKVREIRKAPNEHP
ncbi:helicase, partial [Desulfobacteraceae bacterium SEEP-SAG9]